jgi:hypothetical protein
MKIDCYLSEHCGSYHELRQNIESALQDLKIDAEVDFHTIAYDEAVLLGISGSPTIRVDGAELFAGGGSPGVA